jgi:cyclohexa-1,5-dienecarbonyl-CoA hydratase
VVADPEAVFGQPEIKLAFFPPVAMHQLPRLTGYQNAAYAIFSGENIPADRALSMGLVQKVLAKDQWGEIDDLFNGLSTPVLRITKQALAKSLAEGSAERLNHCKALFMSELYRLEDVSEGITSFEERRPPEWKHR